MIRLDRNAIIYVICPAHIVTGGVEAVHQLVDKLRKFGHDARIVMKPFVDNPLLIQYRNYDVCFAASIDDRPEHLLIVTEVSTPVLADFDLIRKAVWWLSVDNHLRLPNRFEFSDPGHAKVLHLAQSVYAERFLLGQGVCNVYRLTDYLHAEYLRDLRPPKNNVILYTPVKGSQAFVDRLRVRDTSLAWLPLQGMVRRRHAHVLRQAKLYVDFGSHPGKDRQPREAAVNGCCVIVGLRGSARLSEDVPIPSHFKFDLDTFDPEAILATARRCLSEYSATYREFSDFVASIRDEEKHFEQEVIGFVGQRTVRSQRRGVIVFFNILRYARQNSAYVALRGLANELMPPRLMSAVKQRWLNRRFQRSKP